MNFSISEYIAFGALIVAIISAIFANKNTRKSLDITREALEHEKIKRLDELYNNELRAFFLIKEFNNTNDLNEIKKKCFEHCLWNTYHSACAAMIRFIWEVYDNYYCEEENLRRQKSINYLKRKVEPLEYLLNFYGYCWLTIPKSENSTEVAKLIEGDRNKFKGEPKFRQFIESYLVKLDLIKQDDVFIIQVYNLKSDQSELWAGNNQFVEKDLGKAWTGSFAEAEIQEQLSLKCKENTEGLWESYIIKFTPSEMHFKLKNK